MEALIRLQSGTCGTWSLHVRPNPSSSPYQHKTDHHRATQDCGILSFLHVKKCCRIFGRSLDEQNRRMLLIHNKPPDHLSALAGVMINRSNQKECSLWLHTSLCDSWHEMRCPRRHTTCTALAHLAWKCYHAGPFSIFHMGLGVRLFSNCIDPRIWYLLGGYKHLTLEIGGSYSKPFISCLWQDYMTVYLRSTMSCITGTLCTVPRSQWPWCRSWISRRVPVDCGGLVCSPVNRRSHPTPCRKGSAYEIFITTARGSLPDFTCTRRTACLDHAC